MTAFSPVSAHLAAMAMADPDRVAAYRPQGRRNTPATAARYTFRELHEISDALANGLNDAGVGAGVRVAVMVPPSLEFFALTFALFKVAAIPVMIDPGMGMKNLGNCLTEAEPAAFIGVPKAHLARRLFGWAKASLRVTVNVGRGRFFCSHSLAGLVAKGRPRGPYPHPAVAADDLAAILYTSGSTGPAKGVEYTHGIFAAQVELLKSTYGIEPGEIDLCTFPLFALFGPALGMTCVIPEMDATRPARIDAMKTVATIERFGVTNMFGSPAVLRRLAEARIVGKSRLDTLRRVISAGAPASMSVLEEFVTMLPVGVQAFTPYGATEALPVANIGSVELLNETKALTEAGRGVCIGLPVKNVAVSVIPISDGPIPEWSESLPLPSGEVGEFVVRGPIVTRKYFRRDNATAIAKIYDRNTNDILHRMGDVGYIDDRGQLWFCGRKSQRVVTPAGTLFTDMVEPIYNAAGNLRTALIGVTRNSITHPVICTDNNHYSGPFDWNEYVSRLVSRGQLFTVTSRINTFLMYDRPSGFPTDPRHNAKIAREKLAVWADRKLGPKWNGGPA